MFTARFRLLLLTSILLAFFLLAPILLLRASGYRIDPKRFRIVATGAIAVTALPTGTEVRIEEDGFKPERSTAFSPTVLFSNLLPGTYRIHATKEGSVPWKKTVIVEPKKTTVFPFARLFTETPQPLDKTLLRTPLGLASQPKGTLLIGWDHRGIFGVHLKEERTLDGLERILVGDIEQVIWVDDTTLLARFRNSTWMLIRNPQSLQPSIRLLPKTLRAVAVLDEERLVARTVSDAIVTIRFAQEPFILEPFAKDVRAVASRDGVTSYLDNNGTLWTRRLSEETQQRTVVPLETTGRVRLVSGSHGLDIAVIDESGTAWLLYQDDDRFVVAAEGILDALFSTDNTKLLLTGRHEVSFVAVRKRLGQPLRTKGARETVTRLSETIEHASFLPPEEEHVIVVTAGLLRLIELDGRGGRNERIFADVEAFATTVNPPRLLLVSSDGTITAVRISTPGILSQLLL